MKKDLKKIALITAVSTLGLGAVAHKVSEKHEEAKAKAEWAEIKAKGMKKREQNTYYVNARDSLLQVNGYNSDEFKVTYDDLYERIWAIGGELAEIEKSIKYPQQTKLTKQVMEATDKVILKYATQMVQLLRKYRLDVSEDKADEIVTAYKLSKEGVGMFERGGFDYFIEDVFSLGWSSDPLYVDMSAYGELRQKEIVDKVRRIYDDMESEICRTRKAIEKKFAKYFPVLDLQQLPEKYREAVRNQYVYDDNYWYSKYLKPVISISKKVSVADSVLDVEFFGDDKAKYKVVQVSADRWQVVKTCADGTVKKTHVFSDMDSGNACWYNVQFVDDRKECVQEHMDYSIGGKRISVSYEVPVFCKEATAKNVLSPQEEARLKARQDSLTAEKRRLKELKVYSF